MQTGLVTLRTESKLLTKILCLVVNQSPGAAKSKNVVLSTGEAECVALSGAVQERDI